MLIQYHYSAKVWITKYLAKFNKQLDMTAGPCLGPLPRAGDNYATVYANIELCHGRNDTRIGGTFDVTLPELTVFGRLAIAPPYDQAACDAGIFLSSRQIRADCCRRLLPGHLLVVESAIAGLSSKLTNAFCTANVER